MLLYLLKCYVSRGVMTFFFFLLFLRLSCTLRQCCQLGERKRIKKEISIRIIMSFLWGRFKLNSQLYANFILFHFFSSIMFTKKKIGLNFSSFFLSLNSRLFPRWCDLTHKRLTMFDEKKKIPNFISYKTRLYLLIFFIIEKLLSRANSLKKNEKKRNN